MLYGFAGGVLPKLFGSFFIKIMRSMAIITLVLVELDGLDETDSFNAALIFSNNWEEVHEYSRVYGYGLFVLITSVITVLLIDRELDVFKRYEFWDLYRSWGENFYCLRESNKLIYITVYNSFPNHFISHPFNSCYVFNFKHSTD